MTVNQNNTSTESKALIAELASKAFANHLLSPARMKNNAPSGTWTCKAPGSPYYAFHVRFEPGAVMVWGDIGEFILRHSDADSLSWWLSVDSVDYFLGKLRAMDGLKKWFCYGDALAHLDELTERATKERDEDGELTVGAKNVLGEVAHVRAEMARVADDTYGVQHETWVEAWGECDDWDPPQCQSWDTSALWLWEARKKFTALYEAASAGPTKSPEATEILASLGSP